MWHQPTALMGVILALVMGVVSALADSHWLAVENLSSGTHIHGLAFDREHPNALLVATHHGLFRVEEDGKAELISPVQDFMGFIPHPATTTSLLASGHPPEGGNLGVIASADNGATWTSLSPGANGPVDFHQFTVSPADPNVLYGSYHGLQKSVDGGKTWSIAAQLPERTIDLAASSASPDRLYAAAVDGLWESSNSGADWTQILAGPPVSSVEVLEDGTLLAFVRGRGLVRTAEKILAFEDVGPSEWGEQLLFHLAADPTNSARLAAATQHGMIIRSDDAGQSWRKLGG